MVAPTLSEGEGELRVRYFLDSLGRPQFADPDTGRRLGRADALRRVRYSFETNRVVDSFGTFVRVGALRLPTAGTIADFKVLRASWRQLGEDPRGVVPRSNQEIIERLVLIDRDGVVRTVHISHGLGRRYDPTKYGSRWAAEASKAAGVKPGTPEAYTQMKAAVLDRSFLIKTFTPRGE